MERVYQRPVTPCSSLSGEGVPEKVPSADRWEGREQARHPHLRPCRPRPLGGGRLRRRCRRSFERVGGPESPVDSLRGTRPDQRADREDERDESRRGHPAGNGDQLRPGSRRGAPGDDRGRRGHPPRRNDGVPRRTARGLRRSGHAPPQPEPLGEPALDPLVHHAPAFLEPVQLGRHRLIIPEAGGSSCSPGSGCGGRWCAGRSWTWHRPGHRTR